MMQFIPFHITIGSLLAIHMVSMVIEREKKPVMHMPKKTNALKLHMLFSRVFKHFFLLHFPLDIEFRLVS